MKKIDPGVDRRAFLKVATAGAGMSLAGFTPTAGEIHSPQPMSDGSRRSGQVASVLEISGCGRPSTSHGSVPT